MLADLAVAVAAAAVALHGSAGLYLSRHPAASSSGEPRAARAWTGSAAASAYLTIACASAGGARIPGSDGVSAGSLAVFGVTQLAWAASTAWDVRRHRAAAAGSRP